MSIEVSLPDTFCQVRHVKRNGNGQVLIQDMIKQVQAKLEETQVTAVGAMKDTDPTIALGKYA